VLAAPLLARSHWSVLVRSLDRDETVFAHDAGKLVMPASNMKIVTMAATAERFGWDYRFETTLESAAPVVDGTLKGDLIVRGSGDPSIALRDDVAGRTFDTWASQLRAAGIGAIDGRIIGVDDVLADEELGAGWSWDDMAYAYSAPVTGLMYNESLVRITLQPGSAPGSPALLDASPPGDHGLAIRNEVTTGPPASELTLDVTRERGSAILTITGSVPIDVAEPPAFSASVENPTAYFARALKTALGARGIAVRGEAVDADLLSPNDGAGSGDTGLRVLARYSSAPLRDTGRTFMKVSQNQYGELFVKLLGRAAGEGTTEKGQDAIRQTLDAWGVPGDAYVLADGSGLSRLNYLSAETIVRVLEHMYRDARHRDAFLQTLPVGGTDGTLRNRLKAAWTAGRVRAKTGTISNTRALSGYVVTRSGETLVMSIVANNFTLPGWRIERVIDLLVEILARH
jgi:D-alanyl-D-alanine carboxypeptidase/D-alanyl-D-alanine-endopeptidase (penicillin-binding protein 4)